MNKIEGWLMISPFVISMIVIFGIKLKEKGFSNFLLDILAFLIQVAITGMFTYGLWILFK